MSPDPRCLAPNIPEAGLPALIALLAAALLLPVPARAQEGGPRITGVEIGFDGMVNPAPERHYNIPRDPNLLDGPVDRRDDGGHRIGSLAPLAARPLSPVPIRVELAGIQDGPDYRLQVARSARDTGDYRILRSFTVAGGGLITPELDGAFRLRLSPGEETRLELWLQRDGRTVHRHLTAVEAFPEGRVRNLWLPGDPPEGARHTTTLPGLGVWQAGDHTWSTEYLPADAGNLPQSASLADFATVTVFGEQLEELSETTRSRLRQYVARGGVLCISGAGGTQSLTRLWNSPPRSGPELPGAQAVYEYFDGYAVLLETGEETAGGDDGAETGPGEAVERVLEGLLEHRLDRLVRDLDEYSVELRDERYIYAEVTGPPRLGAVPFYREQSAPGSAWHLPALLDPELRHSPSRFIRPEQNPFATTELFLPWSHSSSRVSLWWAVHDAARSAPPVHRALQNTDTFGERAGGVLQELTGRLNSRLSGYLFSAGMLLAVAGVALLFPARIWLALLLAAAGGWMVFQVPAPSGKSAGYSFSLLRGDTAQPDRMLTSSLQLEVRTGNGEGAGRGELSYRPSARFTHSLRTSHGLRSGGTPQISLQGDPGGPRLLSNNSAYHLRHTVLVHNHYPVPLGTVPAGESVSVSFAGGDRTFPVTLNYAGPERRVKDEIVQQILARERSLRWRARDYLSRYELIFQPALGERVFTQSRSLGSSFSSLLESPPGWRERGPSGRVADWMTAQLWLEGWLTGRLDYEGTYLFAWVVGNNEDPLTESDTLLLLRLDLRGGGGDG